jgi:hypothetical protein
MGHRKGLPFVGHRKVLALRGASEGACPSWGIGRCLPFMLLGRALPFMLLGWALPFMLLGWACLSRRTGRACPSWGIGRTCLSCCSEGRALHAARKGSPFMLLGRPCPSRCSDGLGHGLIEMVSVPGKAHCQPSRDVACVRRRSHPVSRSGRGPRWPGICLLLPRRTTIPIQHCQMPNPQAGGAA